VITPREAAAHTFVESVASPVLADEDRHHLERVLRVRAGTVITVSDGRGRWRAVRLGPDLEPCDDVQSAPASAPVITIGFAIVKGDRPEMIARALTEIGVDRLVPMETERGVVRWSGSKADAAVERLQRVVRGAAGQCRRVWLPTVEPVTTFGDLVDERGVSLASPGAAGAPGLEHPTVLVGPEGGWSPGEAAAAAPSVSLGPNILRTETAAIVAGTLLVAARARSESAASPGAAPARG
jgi:16S rRNA (uracil1498-N3)-methyltransferase